MVSRRDVERALEAVGDFDEPDVSREQYLTPPPLASHLCHLAWISGDLHDRVVVDLGTGTGTLALATRFYDPATIVGIDVDGDALAIARTNERRLFDRPSIQWVLGDATSAPLAVHDATVLANPPFGAQASNRHADRRFLDTASTLGAVSYTIHNAGSASFVESFVDDADGQLTHAFESEIPVDRRFAFHTESSVTLPVEVFRIEWR